MITTRVEPRPKPIDLVAAMVLEDGRLWGDIAASFQWADMEAIFRPSSPQSRYWHYETRPRGGSKTTDAACVVLAWLATEAEPGARGYIFASDRDQAALLFDAAAGIVDRTPALQGEITVQTQKLIARSGATCEVRAADGGGAFGLRPSLVLVDELAQWENVRRLRRVWLAIVSGAHKVHGSRLIVLTSAGEPSHWSYEVLQEARRSSHWRTSEVPGPLPWIDPADLEAQRPLMMPSDFSRLHLNLWQQSEDRLVAAEDLDQCVRDDDVPLDPREGIRYVAGLDAGLKHDRTVLSVCHVEKIDGRRIVILDRQFVWQGSREDPVRLADVEATCRLVYEKYNRASFVFDPWQTAGLAQNLRDHRIKVIEFNFNQTSVGHLAQRLYLLLREHDLRLPRDEELLSEIGNVRLREQSPGVFRMDHDANRHDDRAVSLALAAEELLAHPPRRAARMSYHGRIDSDEHPLKW